MEAGKAAAVPLVGLSTLALWIVCCWMKGGLLMAEKMKLPWVRS